ncbi:dienelactone hydrolase family protein [Dactylosporangium sp. CS-047395]|uniref:dienelactone hydrolase family protein n=1 Tax=Dactylosporangium sp. CS-047395 TaxID=3239936 RepID=UPI003D8D231B
MVGHLARPQGDGPWPAVLLGHDGVGLDDYQRGRADDLAARGYLTFAMDYHGGRTYFGEPQAMLDRVLPLLADPARMLTIGRAALDVLLAEPGADRTRLATLGFGGGGQVVLELARTGVPFTAVAVIHPGLPAPRAEDWTDAAGTFLLCTGSEDPICTPAQLLAFGGALQEAGVDWRAHIYGGAQHAFWAAPTGRSLPTVPGVGHHPAHAARAWQAVVDLFKENV